MLATTLDGLLPENHYTFSHRQISARFARSRQTFVAISAIDLGTTSTSRNPVPWTHQPGCGAGTLRMKRLCASCPSVGSLWLSTNYNADRFADLSLADGGGVRGYSMLLLVQAFMHRTIEKCEGVPPSDDQSRPCEYFDLIAGTGTGGLIAIMLGRLRMSIKECLQTYEEMTKFVFETDKTIAGIPYRSTLFKASKLEDAIKDSVRKYADRNDDDLTDQFIEMPKSPRRAGSMHSYNSTLQRRSTSSTLRRSSYLPASVGRGDPNADLEDFRPNATKT